jgi:hypothetical protein
MQNFLAKYIPELGKVNPASKVWAVQHSTLQMNKDLLYNWRMKAIPSSLVIFNPN